MSKKESRYLSLSLLKTFGISSLLTLVVYQIINAKYSHTFEQKQGDFIESMAGIFWILVLTISALTVYLNLINRIRAIPIFSFLSFFFMPLFVSILVWSFGDRNGQWISFYVSTFIFLFTLTFFYIRFSKMQ
jgi:cobalamin synthase